MVRPSYRANFTSGTGDSPSPTADPFFGLVFDPSLPGTGPITTTATICWAAIPAGDATSAGRRSLTSATGRSRTTRRSTPRSPACCSPCRCPRSPRIPRQVPPFCRNATCCASSLGGLPRARRRGRDEGAGAQYQRPLGPRGGVRVIRHQHAAVVLHPRRSQDDRGGIHLGPVGGRIVTETLIGLLRADPTSYLSAFPRFQPFLGTDLRLGPNVDTNITGNRAYTRAHFLCYAGVVQPGVYR